MIVQNENHLMKRSKIQIKVRILLIIMIRDTLSLCELNRCAGPMKIILNPRVTRVTEIPSNKLSTELYNTKLEFYGVICLKLLNANLMYQERLALLVIV